MRGANKAVHFAAALLLATPVAAETVRVVALGDSLTAGYGLPESEGFVPQLQAWLDAEGVDAEIVNAGVSGDTTAGGLARLGWSLDAETDAMIVALGGNDLLRGLPPAVSRDNLEAILSQVTGERGLPVLLIGLEAPGNYGADYQAEFDAMYPDLAAEWDALHVDSFLGSLTEEAALDEARARYMQPDGIHPNRDGVGVIVAAIGPRVVELVDRADP
ncbi:Esterase TesA precursor [Jannaschia seosinensis]|uniref:Esterase TesA n=2 Tax=Jannaschia seosinensis TaxID=313367 RepID=A0A0M7BD58_9RHOB|nr:arylesterase [Jannaschia seosinensis]CUH40331.1 Esterase TesA precursor [Jannaschia seosinensis]